MQAFRTVLSAAFVVALQFSAVAVAPLADCVPTSAPIIASPPAAPATLTYDISWTADLDATPTFELQEATAASFADAVTIPVDGALLQTIAAHAEIVADTRYFYRVRGISACDGGTGPWSRIGSTLIAAKPGDRATAYSIAMPAETTLPFVQDYLVPGFGETATNEDRFQIVVDAVWLTVFPPEGALSAGGTTVQFTIDPTNAPAGTHEATLVIRRTQPSTSVASTIPIVVDLGPSVRLQPRTGSPPGGTRIILGVAHEDGLDTRFQSDVRLVNTGTETITYELAYTPTASSGLVTGKTIRFDLEPNASTAFDDIVLKFFSAGFAEEVGIGSLEVRPISAAGGGEPSPSATIASSRTYSVTDAGTFGQFIPALSNESFVGSIASDPLARLSLQQIASSAEYRTNVGFVEASGAPADLLVTLFDKAGTLLEQVPFSLAPFEHRQLNLNDPELFAGVTIDAARIEIEVTSETGLVTAYASVLDNQTSDPLFDVPVIPSRSLTSRTVLPGVAAVDGEAKLQSDMRAYNAGSTPVSVTFDYRPKTGDGTSVPEQLTAILDAHEVLEIKDVLQSLWGLDGTSGALTVGTDALEPLVVSARTFSHETSSGGTYGQLTPGIRSTAAVGASERALEVLQLVQSVDFRSDLGILELAGSPAVVEITAHSSGPDATATTSFELSGGEFRLLESVFTQLDLPVAHNGRISVRVLSGDGRVSCYGSVIDSGTGDSTYIPAQ